MITRKISYRMNQQAVLKKERGDQFPFYSRVKSEEGKADQAKRSGRQKKHIRGGK